MATVTAGKWGYIVGTNSTSWTTARTSAATAQNQPISNGVKMRVLVQSARGGGLTNSIYRIFMAFDVSAYSSGYTISGLTLNFRGSTLGTATLGTAVVSSTAQGDADTDLTTADFTNWTTTQYASYWSWTDTNTDWSISLNAAAISAFDDDYLKLAMLQSSNDFSGIDPGTATDKQAAWNMDTAGGGGYIPYLDFTATLNTGGVIGVDDPDISLILGKKETRIAKIIGTTMN